ncbi:unnamed protein product [Mycetohabitans rhizoxinica HKI 454]|uniref:Uncharacterized protein n=1 Tax=Mycetohabitans rhizoxinica (strain DSM 19002 / CIP 109453 / HKI 454) TaxID=882378 RepID=E5ALS4_MYCRK|nr:unnamed protein product [Mycetohabitans rhizoxinica HKI 454]
MTPGAGKASPRDPVSDARNDATRPGSAPLAAD